MYIHELVMQSKKPHEIATFDTIIYPFDTFIWILSLSSMATVFVMLLLMQKSWYKASGKPNKDDYVFEGHYILF